MLVNIDDAADYVGTAATAECGAELVLAALQRAATSGWPDDIAEATEAVEEFVARMVVQLMAHTAQSAARAGREDAPRRIAA